MVEERKIPAGYKNTEAGMLPEEWEVGRLGKVLRVCYGKDQRLVEDKNGLYPILGSGGQIGWSNRYLYAKESVLIGRKGTIDNPKFVESPFWTIDTLFYTEIFEQAVPKYLYYVFKTINWASLNEATGVPSLNANIIENVKIALPSLLEQQTIAEALSDMDDLIESVEKLIDKKQKIKEGAMQGLLTGKRRLPGFTEEWEEKKIGNVTEIFNGGTPSTSKGNYWDGEINFCTPTDITNCKSKYIFKTKRKITSEGLNSCSTPLLPKGALLLCSRATIGEVRIAGTAMATNQGFKSLVCNNMIDNEFLYYRLLQLKELLISKASGSTFLEVSKKDLSDLGILMPCKNEQSAIAKILSDMDSDIEALEKKLNKYRAIKQGMMQELLTGRSRLI